MYWDKMPPIPEVPYAPDAIENNSMDLVMLGWGVRDATRLTAAGWNILIKGSQSSFKVVSNTKLLQQFTPSTMDEATSLTITQKGKHLFSNNLHPKPWLNELSNTMGGNEKVIRAALENANGRILPNAEGIFNTPVTVGGVNFTIRGFVNKGKPIINSIFIP